MQYSPSDLSVLAYANGFTLWHYTTFDTLEQIMGVSYFDAADNILRKGDLIIVNYDLDEAPGMTQIAVAGVEPGSVVVAKHS